MRGDTEKFLSEIEAFLKATRISATRFGAIARGDTKFVPSVRKGRVPRPDTMAEVRLWMRVNRAMWEAA